MKISEYIKIMKDNRPQVLDPQNIYQQFYEVNEKVLDLLLQTKRITNSQYDRLWLINECIMGEIIISWLGKDYQIFLRNVNANDEVLYFRVCSAIEPKTNSKVYLFGKSNVSINDINDINR